MPPAPIPAPSRQQYLNRIEKSIQFINQNLSSSLDLSQVAQAAGFSPYHFHRIFTALMDENPQDFINRLRLERAANLLVKSPSLSITEVAYTCGFSSSSTFARSFKKYFGLPASEYARRTRRGDQLPAWVTAHPEAPRSPLDLPPVQVKIMPSLHLAYFISRHGYRQSSVIDAWERLFRWANAHGLATPAAQLVAISFDDPEITPPHKCRYFACLTVPGRFQSDRQACFMDIPESACAVCRLACDANQIPLFYRAIYRDWLPDSGFLLTDLPPYELIYNAPEVDSNSKYVFDLCIPVAAA